MQNLSVKRQVELPVFYKGVDLCKKYRLDLLVEDEIIVELKTVDQISTLHKAQVLSYMKLAKKRLGYVANFNVCMMREGIKRIRLDSGTKFHKEPLINVIRCGDQTASFD